MSYVSIRGLAKQFGEAQIFKDINLDIEQGNICALVGPSGCGKTTLLRAVAGLTYPDLGTIEIDGKDVTRLEAKQRGIGMVFQHYALFPNMTVEQNLAFGLEQMQLPSNEITSKVSAMIELMDLGSRSKARPGALSGGQKQRVALARALVLEPKLLLLDEPLSALDAQIRKRLREELKRLQREVGFTAIFVTHDQEEALLLGDVIGVMLSGRFAQVGIPSAIYSHPSSIAVAKFIGDFNILDPTGIQRVFGKKTKMNWAIHPQAMEIAPGRRTKTRAGVYDVEASVTATHVLGSIMRYAVESNGVPLKIDALNRPNMAAVHQGQSVRLCLAAADVCELSD